MTNRIAVGTPVTVIDRTGNYLNDYGMTHDDLVVLSDANGVGYGVGPSTNDPHKAHSRHGWIYFSKTEVTPKPQESKVTQFKAGDKVEFIEEYMTYASRGTKATVQRNSIGEFTDVRVDSTGETLCPFTRRLKLAEEPALTLKGFTVGDKVRYNGYLWQNLEGVVSSINGGLLDIRVTKLHDNAGSYSSVQVGKTLVEACGGKGIDTGSLEKIEEPAALKVGDKVTFFEEGNECWQGGSGIITSVNPDNRNRYYEIKLIEAPPRNVAYVAGNTVRFPRNNTTVKAFTPFTFKDIQVGDTIRRTSTFKGATEVREGVVGSKGTYYWANAQGNYILAYDTDGNGSIKDVTLELLNRPEPEPEPEPVKEVWEDAKVGDYLITVDKDGCKRIHTKQECGKWATLIVNRMTDGKAQTGYTRSNTTLANFIKDYTVGIPEFVKA